MKRHLVLRLHAARRMLERDISIEEIENVVFAHVAQLQIPQKWYTDTLVYLREGEEWDDLRRQRRAVQTRLSAAREMLKQEIIGPGEFRQLERECRRRLENLKRKTLAGDARYEKLLRDFPRLWAAATVEERKGLLRCIFSSTPSRWTTGDNRSRSLGQSRPARPYPAALRSEMSSLPSTNAWVNA